MMGLVAILASASAAIKNPITDGVGLTNVALGLTSGALLWFGIMALHVRSKFINTVGDAADNLISKFMAPIGGSGGSSVHTSSSGGTSVVNTANSAAGTTVAADNMIRTASGGQAGIATIAGAAAAGGAANQLRDGEHAIVNTYGAENVGSDGDDGTAGSSVHSMADRSTAAGDKASAGRDGAAGGSAAGGGNAIGGNADSAGGRGGDASSNNTNGGTYVGSNGGYMSERGAAGGDAQSDVTVNADSVDVHGGMNGGANGGVSADAVSTAEGGVNGDVKNAAAVGGAGANGVGVGGASGDGANGAGGDGADVGNIENDNIRSVSTDQHADNLVATGGMAQDDLVRATSEARDEARYGEEVANASSLSEMSTKNVQADEVAGRTATGIVNGQSESNSHSDVNSDLRRVDAAGNQYNNNVRAVGGAGGQGGEGSGVGGDARGGEGHGGDANAEGKNSKVLGGPGQNMSSRYSDTKNVEAQEARESKTLGAAGSPAGRGPQAQDGHSGQGGPGGAGGNGSYRIGVGSMSNAERDLMTQRSTGIESGSRGVSGMRSTEHSSYGGGQGAAAYGGAGGNGMAGRSDSNGAAAGMYRQGSHYGAGTILQGGQNGVSRDMNGPGAAGRDGQDGANGVGRAGGPGGAAQMRGMSVDNRGADHETRFRYGAGTILQGGQNGSHVTGQAGQAGRGGEAGRQTVYGGSPSQHTTVNQYGNRQGDRRRPEQKNDTTQQSTHTPIGPRDNSYGAPRRDVQLSQEGHRGFDSDDGEFL